MLGFRKFNMVNNINYDINNWMHVSMKTSYIRTELDGLAQDAVHGESWIGNDTQPLMPVKHPDGNWSGQGNYTNFAIYTVFVECFSVYLAMFRILFWASRKL